VLNWFPNIPHGLLKQRYTETCFDIIYILLSIALLSHSGMIALPKLAHTWPDYRQLSKSRLIRYTDFISIPPPPTPMKNTYPIPHCNTSIISNRWQKSSWQFLDFIARKYWLYIQLYLSIFGMISTEIWGHEPHSLAWEIIQLRCTIQMQWPNEISMYRQVQIIRNDIKDIVNIGQHIPVSQLVHRFLTLGYDCSEIKFLYMYL